MDEKNRTYSNKDITVYWRPGKCIHSSICYTKLIDVFNPVKRPWVDLEAAPSEKIIEIVNKCPTEALMWKWNDAKKNDSVTKSNFNHIKIRRPYGFAELDEKKQFTPDPVNIQIMKNGPLVVRGEIKLITPEGAQMKTGEFTSFCRCGQSNSMPYCDGMHRKIVMSDEF